MENYSYIIYENEKMVGRLNLNNDNFSYSDLNDNLQSIVNRCLTSGVKITCSKMLAGQNTYINYTVAAVFPANKKFFQALKNYLESLNYFIIPDYPDLDTKLNALQTKLADQPLLPKLNPVGSGYLDKYLTYAQLLIAEQHLLPLAT